MENQYDRWYDFLGRFTLPILLGLQTLATSAMAGFFAYLFVVVGKGYSDYLILMLIILAGVLSYINGYTLMWHLHGRTIHPAFLLISSFSQANVFYGVGMLGVFLGWKQTGVELTISNIWAGIAGGILITQALLFLVGVLALIVMGMRELGLTDRAARAWRELRGNDQGEAAAVQDCERGDYGTMDSRKVRAGVADHLDNSNGVSVEAVGAMKGPIKQKEGAALKMGEQDSLL